MPNPVDPYALLIHFKNSNVGFFEERISLSNTIGSGCKVEVLWSATNAQHATLGDEVIVEQLVTTGAGDSYGFGYWNGSIFSMDDLPDSTGYVWARVYNRSQSHYVNVGEINLEEEQAALLGSVHGEKIGKELAFCRGSAAVLQLLADRGKLSARAREALKSHSAALDAVTDLPPSNDTFMDQIAKVRGSSRKLFAIAKIKGRVGSSGGGGEVSV